MRTVTWIIDKSQKETQLHGGKLSPCHFCFFQKFHFASHEDILTIFIAKEHDKQLALLFHFSDCRH